MVHRLGSVAQPALHDAVLNGSSVRMIVCPTISGHSVRLKLENTLGQSPVVFSNVYLGAQRSGAAVCPAPTRN